MRMRMDAYRLRRETRRSEQRTWWVVLRGRRWLVEERERDRRDLSSVSLSAVPLFVNTLARPLLAKSQVRPQRFRFGFRVNRVFKSKLRSLVPISPHDTTYLTPTNPYIAPASAALFNLANGLASHIFLAAEVAQATTVNLVWASRYASLLYPYPCLSLENDALSSSLAHNLSCPPRPHATFCVISLSPSKQWTMSDPPPKEASREKVPTIARVGGQRQAKLSHATIDEPDVSPFDFQGKVP